MTPPTIHRPILLPAMTRALVAVNVLVFLSMAAAGAGVFKPDAIVHIAWGSNFAPLTVDGQWWRLLTSTFVHFGALHLFFNMWVLWGTGALVERLFGHGRFLAIYGVAGVVGGLASVTWNPLVNSAGASGAIFGLIGAQLAFFMRGGHRIPAEVIRAQRASIVGFIAFSVVFGMTVPGIDNAAHLGGLVSGFLLGWLLARPLGVPSSARVARGGMVLAAILSGAVILAGIRVAERVARSHHDEQAFLREWNRFSVQEPKVLSSMKETMAAVREGKLGDARLVETLEHRTIPFYQDALDRLGSPSLPQSSPLAGQQAQAVTFTRGRVAGFTLMATGIRERDSAKLEQAAGQLGGSDAGVNAQGGH